MQNNSRSSRGSHSPDVQPFRYEACHPRTAGFIFISLITTILRNLYSQFPKHIRPSLHSLPSCNIQISLHIQSSCHTRSSCNNQPSLRTLLSCNIRLSWCMKHIYLHCISCHIQPSCHMRHISDPDIQLRHTCSTYPYSFGCYCCMHTTQRLP